MQAVARAQRAREGQRKNITLKTIQAAVEDDLHEFQRYYRGAVQSRIGLLNRVVRYVLKQKGKQIRPTLVLLAARACGDVQQTSYRAAALVELLHTATLVHDDVVDEAETRRGVFSVNTLWKNKLPVLLGDYLLSQGLLLALRYNDYEILQILSDVVRRMSEGELLQIEKSRSLDIDEPTYFRIISDKTASLLGACAACGAYSASEDWDLVERMRNMGEYLGLAFQIRDDIFDYGGVGTGKPVGVDLQGKKMTLPLIHALQNVDVRSRARIMKIVRKSKKSREDRRTVVQFVEEAGGLAYARDRMGRYAQLAKETLLPLPPTPARAALIDLTDYVVARKK